MRAQDHTGVKGNKMADELARKGDSTHFSGLEPTCNIPTFSVKTSKKNHQF